MSFEYRDGQFVNQKVAQVVEAIRDYAPDIRVDFIPESARTPGQAAYRLVHCPENREEYTIFHVQNDEDFDSRVLKKLIMGDQRVSTVTYSELEATEMAAQMVAKQKFMDQMEEANEIASAVFRSSKSTYKVSKDLVIKDYLHGNHASKPKVL